MKNIQRVSNVVVEDIEFVLDAVKDDFTGSFLHAFQGLVVVLVDSEDERIDGHIIFLLAERFEVRECSLVDGFYL